VPTLPMMECLLRFELLSVYGRYLEEACLDMPLLR